MKLAAAFLGLSFLCQFATATEYQHEKFSLDIPQYWAVVPIDTVNKRLKEIGSPEDTFQLTLTPTAKLESYFDPKAVDRMPNVNIQDSPVGYLNAAECRKALEELETINAGFSSSEYGPFKRSRTVTFLVTGTDGSLAGQRFEIVAKMVCTMSGVIIVHAGNKADDETYKPDIQQILHSFSVADRYKWKELESNTDRIVNAGKRGIQSALGLGLIGSILGLVAFFLSRGSKLSTKKVNVEPLASPDLAGAERRNPDRKASLHRTKRSKLFRVYCFLSACWSLGALVYIWLFHPYGAWRYMDGDDKARLLFMVFGIPALVGIAIYVYRRYVK